MAQVIEIAVDLEKNPSIEVLKRQIDLLNARCDTHICRLSELEKKQKNDVGLLKERIEFLEGALKASLEKKQPVPPSAPTDETDETPTEKKTSCYRVYSRDGKDYGIWSAEEFVKWCKGKDYKLVYAYSIKVK
jgi:hypothetical protein